ncbi:MAG: 30S ribosomal protein S17e [Methanomicrobiales archaeon]|jgi:small subunit ribosomal protein S17e|nr:30S ribosomal protein S17e [Methanomicrobiales archaeon]
MGIKPTYIKAIGNELLEKHASHFTNEFELNKLAVTNTTSITSKRVRNRVAGFITRKINTKRVQ